MANLILAKHYQFTINLLKQSKNIGATLRPVLRALFSKEGLLQCRAAVYTFL